MKKLVLFSFILCGFFLSLNVEPIQTVYANTSTYYKIENSNTALLRSPTEGDTYFILPPTYFVKLIQEYDDDYLEVSYLDFCGFVKKSDVIRVYSTPKAPYLENIVFKPNPVANLIIRSSPSTQANFLGTIPFNAENVVYFGWIEGEETNLKLGNTWYFCRYSSAEQGTVTGYVYAPLTQELTQISSNNEAVELSPSNPVSGDISISPELQSGSNLIFIFFLSIPAILILVLIFRSHNKRPKKVRQRLKMLRQHSDDELDF